MSDMISPSDRALHLGSRVALHPVRKAYEQVADQLHELIVSGKLPTGARLPSESALAKDFGVSRTTVREALRLLAAQRLIKTGKGPMGGSYVTLPTVDHISQFLTSSLGLLTEAQDVSLEEFLEVRELLEVRAAALAATRAGSEDVQRLREAIPDQPLRLTAQEQFAYNKTFHAIVLETSRNMLLCIAAQPVFSVLQGKLARSSLGQSFHRTLNEHHRAITASIAAGDADAAAEQMRSHLEFLRPAYEKAWRSAFSRPSS